MHRIAHKETLYKRHKRRGTVNNRKRDVLFIDYQPVYWHPEHRSTETVDMCHAVNGKVFCGRVAQSDSAASHWWVVVDRGRLRGIQIKSNSEYMIYKEVIKTKYRLFESLYSSTTQKKKKRNIHRNRGTSYTWVTGSSDAILGPWSQGRCSLPSLSAWTQAETEK